MYIGNSHIVLYGVLVNLMIEILGMDIVFIHAWRNILKGDKVRL